MYSCEDEVYMHIGCQGNKVAKYAIINAIWVLPHYP